MTITMQSGSKTRHRGPSYSPARPQNVGALQVELAKLVGLAPKTVEERLAQFRPLLDRLPEAARRAQRMDWLDFYFAAFDAHRAIGADPLECTPTFACAINRDILAESGSLAEYLADKSAAHRHALRKQTLKVQREAAELLAALDTV